MRQIRKAGVVPVRRARALVGAGLLLMAALLLVSLAMTRYAPALRGTRLDGWLAPDFTLIDRRGQTEHLQDLRGKAVALTFI